MIRLCLPICLLVKNGIFKICVLVYKKKIFINTTSYIKCNRSNKTLCPLLLRKAAAYTTIKTIMYLFLFRKLKHKQVPPFVRRNPDFVIFIVICREKKNEAKALHDH